MPLLWLFPALYPLVLYPLGKLCSHYTVNIRESGGNYYIGDRLLPSYLNGEHHLTMDMLVDAVGIARVEHEKSEQHLLEMSRRMEAMVDTELMCGEREPEPKPDLALADLWSQMDKREFERELTEVEKGIEPAQQFLSSPWSKDANQTLIDTCLRMEAERHQTYLAQAAKNIASLPKTSA